MKTVRLVGLLCILASVGLVTGVLLYILQSGPDAWPQDAFLFIIMVLACALLAAALCITGIILFGVGLISKD